MSTAAAFETGHVPQAQNNIQHPCTQPKFRSPMHQSRLIACLTILIHLLCLEITPWNNTVPVHSAYCLEIPMLGGFLEISCLLPLSYKALF